MLLRQQQYIYVSFLCQNVTANHRLNDVVFTEDGTQTVTGRFMYGPLDMVTLTGEKVTANVKRSLCAIVLASVFSHVMKSQLVANGCYFRQIDIHIMTQPPSGEWVYFNTEVTNSSGRVSYVIPEGKRLGIGVYPVKMVVRYAEFLFQNGLPS